MLARSKIAQIPHNLVRTINSAVHANDVKDLQLLQICICIVSPELLP